MALARAIVHETKQNERAVIVGLTTGAQLSRRESRLATGESDTYVEAYLAHHFLRLAQAVPGLRDAVLAFLNGTEPMGDDQRCERNLSAFGQAAARELADIMQDAGDGIDRIEAAKHRTALLQLKELIGTSIVDLDRRANGGKRGTR